MSEQRGRGPGRKFTKGQSGNPKGRPPAGWSLAEAIREALTPERRRQLLAQMITLAAEPHGDPHARIKAAEWLAKHGWPGAQRDSVTVTSDGPAKITVIHELHPPKDDA